MTAIQLTPAQRKEHRAAAHHLDPVVLIGSDGLTPAVLKETHSALKAHGLIKVRVFSDDREERAALLERLADELNAAPIQQIGKLLVLWRPLPAKEKAGRRATAAGPSQDSGELPRGAGAQRLGANTPNRKPAPKVVKIVKFSKSGNHRPQVKKVTVFGNERVTAGGSIKRAKKRQATSVKKTAKD